MPHPSLAPSWLAVSGPCARMDASWILERMHAATSIVAFSSPCMRSASTNVSLCVCVRACVVCSAGKMAEAVQVYGRKVMHRAKTLPLSL